MKTIETEASRSEARRMESDHWLLPPVNVFELPDAYVIEADMPGVTREGLEVRLEGHTLTLAGRRDHVSPAGAPLYVESKRAGFQRAFEIDPAINASKIAARLEQGLLTVHLPKAEKVKPHRIPVSD